MERKSTDKQTRSCFKTAETARLAMLQPDDAADMRRDLAAMISIADELCELDAAPTETNGQQHISAMRADIPQAGLSISDALMNSKSTRGRLITVPRAFD